MRIRPSSLTVAAVLVSALPVACSGTPDDGAATAPSPAPRLAANEELASQREDTFAETGARVVRRKVIDRARGVLRDETVDALDGHAVDFETLRAAEVRARRARFGAFDPSFAAEVARAPGAVLAADVLSAERGPEGAELAAYLERAGATVTRTDGAVASVEAPARVLTALSRDLIIESIAPREAAVTTALSAARDLVEDSLWWSHAWGIGSDLRVAVVEPNACIRRTHKDFQLLTFEARVDGPTCDLAAGWHSTTVAGTLAAARLIDGVWNTAGLFRGRLFDSILTTGAVNRNPHFINMSATHSVIEVRSLDAAVWDKRISVFAGSSNSDSGTSGATCHAYNLTCVGGYLTKGTIGAGSFADDEHSSFAMWQNPVSGREEPDLVGPISVRAAGYRSDTDYETAGGTSFSTPAVTGLAALLVAKHRTQLERQPTLMRALLTASAISHPVADGDGTRIPIIGDGRDDKTGAGAPNGKTASSIVEASSYHAARVVKSTDFDAAGKYTRTFSTSASAGQRVRVALAWDNCPVSPLTYPNQDALIVDLDLAVRGPNAPITISPLPIVKGTLSTRSTVTAATLTAPFFAANASHVDNYETVEFVAPVAGTYRFEVTAPRWGQCPHDGGYATNLALAWAKE
jgi:hypothetical protein